MRTFTPRGSASGILSLLLSFLWRPPDHPRADRSMQGHELSHDVSNWRAPIVNRSCSPMLSVIYQVGRFPCEVSLCLLEKLRNFNPQWMLLVA